MAFEIAISLLTNIFQCVLCVSKLQWQGGRIIEEDIFVFSKLGDL